MSAPPVEDRAGRGRAPAPAGGDRLPAPVRERRPALAALAVLLIVGGALASALVVLRTGHQSSYLVLARTVEAGEQITDRDLTTTNLAGGSGVSGISASSRRQVVGRFATTRIDAHTLASPKMFTPDRTVQAGYVEVGAVLSSAQRPDSLTRGDVVRVLQVPKDSGSDRQILVMAARIVAAGQVGSGSGTNGQPVTLRVPSDSALDVASAAGRGELIVTGLPVGTEVSPGTPDASTSAGGTTADGTATNGTTAGGSGTNGTTANGAGTGLGPTGTGPR